MSPALCDFSPARLLILGENVAPLVYYSHLPVAILSLIIGLSVLIKGGKSLASRTLFIITASFSLWVLLDSIFWASNRSDIIMFVWAVILLIEPIVHAGSVYLIYQLFENKNPPFLLQVFMGMLFLPLILLVPTDLALSRFDIATCLAEEGPIALYYTYLVEAIFTAVVIIYAVAKFATAKEWSEKLRVFIVSLGIVILLFAFSWGNIIGSFTEDWELGQYGLFGMPIFTAFLAYSIVKFKLFNIKVIGANLLVIALWILIGSLLALQDLNMIRRVVTVTFAISIVFGLILIRSVKKEVSLREDLEVANEGQANLLHIINHQIKGYLTKSRLIFDDLLEDSSYGLSEKAKPMVKQGFDSVTEGVNFVQDFLNTSNIERGTFEYNMEPVDFREVVEKASVSQKENAVKKNLTLDLAVGEGQYHITGDKAQLTQAVRNLMDNSINYTPTGGLKVSLAEKGGKVTLKVSDTGVGLSEEVKPKLFTKGGRDKDSQKINVNSTGFGLAFVKGVAEAHKGRVWAESPGVGKGSTFYMELPLA